MKFAVGGPVRLRLELNGLMIAGGVVFLVGAGSVGVGLAAGLGKDSPLQRVAWGVLLLGIALYFAGRLVHLLRPHGSAIPAESRIYRVLVYGISAVMLGGLLWASRDLWLPGPGGE